MDGMSGAPNERAVFSAITLALIDDTGWYNANWNLQVQQSSSLLRLPPSALFAMALPFLFLF